MTTVSFPGLGWELEMNRVAFTVPGLGIQVHWYGLIITFGMVLAYLYLSRREKKQGRNPDDIIDVALYALPCAIIGARAYYVFFRWESYRGEPLDAFKIWEGGLAIYGGIIGALLAALIYCLIKKHPFLRYADMAAFGLLIGQSIGRWGNFVNGEAYGGPCTMPWRMVVSGEAYPVHPTFLYESLWNLCLFLILHFVEKKKRRKQGFFFCLYLMGYGLGRVWIEALRSDSLYLAGSTVKVSQLVALLSIVIGAVGLWLLSKKTKKLS